MAWRAWVANVNFCCGTILLVKIGLDNGVVFVRNAGRKIQRAIAIDMYASHETEEVKCEENCVDLLVASRGEHRRNSLVFQLPADLVALCRQLDD